MPSRTITVQDVRSKATSKGFDIYITVDQDGTEYSTKKRDLAESAKSLIGKQAEIEYTEARNGNFLNHYLDGILPVRPTEASSNGFTRQRDPDLDERIMRQTASKVAVQQLRYFMPDEQNVATLRELTDMWVDYYQNGWSDEVPSALPVDDSIPF